jgi:hypothetical protein
MDIFSLPLKIISSILVAVILLVLIIRFLYLKYKSVTEQVDFEKTRISKYKIEMQNLRNSPLENPEKDFEFLNKYVRGFFKEYFGLSYSLTYLELKEAFKKQKKEDYSKFCESMSNVDYSGNKKKKEEIENLISLFSKLLNNY